MAPQHQQQAEPTHPETSTTVQLQAANGVLSDTSTWLRVVEPYIYTFKAFAKRRWLGRSVLSIYHDEFGSYPKSYYEHAIQQGRILVSERQVHPSYILKDGDVLTHTVHLHEPVVALSCDDNGHIEVIAETDTLVVVSKPSTLPVHPCGVYKQNSLVNILEPQFGKLHPVHRLDRLTSGIVLLAKSPTAARQWGECIRKRDSCEKIYLARVQGKFPKHACELAPELVCLGDDEEEQAFPIGGEKNYKHWHGGETDKAMNANEMRDNNALGYWITDSSGHAAKAAGAVSLEQVSASRGEIHQWLSSLDKDKVSPKAVDISVDDDDDDDDSTMLLWFHLSCPVRIATPKGCLCKAGSFEELDDDCYRTTVKPAQTSFAVVRYDKDTDSTILLCRPVTGRSHQIRLHLQFLGHPIATDEKYGGVGATQLASDLDGPVEHDFDASPRGHGESQSEFIERTCVLCARARGGDHDGRTSSSDRAIREFQSRSQGIWLHAFRYTMTDYKYESEGTKISYETKIPSWAR